MTAPTTDRLLLDLHMPVDPQGSAAAVAPLAWCVTKKLTAEVEAQGFVNPMLVVINRTPKSERFGLHTDTYYVDKAVLVVPLKQALAYLSFSSPGANEVHAFVVDVRPNTNDARHLRDFMRHIPKRDLDESVIRQDGTIERSRFGDGLHPNLRVLKDETESLTVNVPAEMFAPPPAQWRQNLVKKFFKGKAQDQCHFRRRFWFVALPLFAPIALMLYLAKIVLTGAGYAAGVRGFAVKASFKDPLGHPADLWDRSEKVYFAPVEDRENNARLSIWSLLNVFVIATLLLVFWGVTAVGVGNVLKVALTVGVVAALVAGLAVYKHSPARARREAAREERAREHLRLENLVALNAMLCETNLPANSVGELPKEKQTVSLRFYDFKTKVCKPFAR